MATAAKWWYIKSECTNSDGSLNPTKVSQLCDINGVKAEKVLQDNFFKNARKLFLIYDDETNQVSQIQSLDIIKSGNKKYSGKSDDEVLALYLEDQINPPAPQPSEQDQANLDMMEAQLTIYEQNAQILDILNNSNA